MLGAVTVAVAVLSVAVSYQILEPVFGGWAVPTVGALDILWCIFQATEILSGNNRVRANRVRNAGLALTVVNAAIPTVDLIVSSGQFNLAVVLTPVAIVATKGAWWLTLPSLGRKTSAGTRQSIGRKRQEVADRLERMEADAADRIELLTAAAKLEEQVADAETQYRLKRLEIQQSMTDALYTQAQATEATITEKPLPASVAAIPLPDLDSGTWTPSAPALPVTAHRDTSGAGARALAAGRDASGTDATGSHADHREIADDRHTSRHGDGDEDRDAVTLAELAAVAGVPTPQPGEPLTDGQMDVVLRHMRYREDPPASYRKAVADFRDRGFVGGEQRVRRAWAALMSKEDDELSEDSEEEASES